MGYHNAPARPASPYSPISILTLHDELASSSLQRQPGLSHLKINRFVSLFKTATPCISLMNSLLLLIRPAKVLRRLATVVPSGGMWARISSAVGNEPPAGGEGAFAAFTSVQ